MKIPVYPYVITYEKNEEEVYWAARSSVLSGCVAQGETREAALDELAENEEAWIETAVETGMQIPENMPQDTKRTKYSGKFTARVSPRVHRMAAEEAERQGISLAQFVSDAMMYYATVNDNKVEDIANKVAEQVLKKANEGEMSRSSVAYFQAYQDITIPYEPADTGDFNDLIYSQPQNTRRH